MLARRAASAGVVAVLAVVTASSCSSGDTGGTGARERIEAATEQASELGGDDVFTQLSAEELSCVEERALEEDFAPLAAIEDSSQEGVEARVQLLSILIDCVPDLPGRGAYAATFTASLDAAYPGFDVDETEGTCVLRYIIDNGQDPARLIVEGTGDDFIDVRTDALETCLDETSAAVLAGEPGSGPQSVGDDADLDVLYDDCGDGDDIACDLLYYSVNEGGDYHLLARDCAGRQVDVENFCTSGLLLDADGWLDVDSPALPTLLAECEAGAMTTCDLLFSVAPPGSDAVLTGFTCGGKIAVGAVPNCRTRFGS